MEIGASLVLFAIIWFMCLYIVLPLKLTTQGDVNDVTPGTPASALVSPSFFFRLRKPSMLPPVYGALEFDDSRVLDL